MPFRTQKIDQTGAVAMITVIFIAIVLTIVVTGFIRLSVSNERESTDDDLTTRAFYAAESGVEEARDVLEQFVSGLISEADLLSQYDSCDDTTTAEGTLSNDLEAAYTCLLIDLSPDSFQAELQANGKPVVIPLRSSSSYDQMVIEWHLQGEEANNSYTLRTNSDLPQANSWGDSPAILRAQTFRHSSSSLGTSTWRTASTNGVFSNDETVFLMPHTGGSTTMTADLAGASNDQDLRNVRCTAGAADGSYVCSLTVNLASSAAWNNYLSLRAIYANTNVRVTLLNSGNPVDIDGAQAVVDVTGRANDVFRRVETRIPLSDVSELEDYALLSGERICKFFPVTDDVADFPSTIGNVNEDDYLCE